MGAGVGATTGVGLVMTVGVVGLVMTVGVVGLVMTVGVVGRVMIVGLGINVGLGSTVANLKTTGGLVVVWVVVGTTGAVGTGEEVMGVLVIL